MCKKASGSVYSGCIEEVLLILGEVESRARDSLGVDDDRSNEVVSRDVSGVVGLHRRREERPQHRDWPAGGVGNYCRLRPCHEAEAEGWPFRHAVRVKEIHGKVAKESTIHDICSLATYSLAYGSEEERDAHTHTDGECYLEVIGINSVGLDLLRQHHLDSPAHIGGDDAQLIAVAQVP